MNHFQVSLETLGFEIEEDFKLIGYVTTDRTREAIRKFVSNGRLRGHDMAAVVIMTHGEIAGQDQEFAFSGEL